MWAMGNIGGTAYQVEWPALRHNVRERSYGSSRESFTDFLTKAFIEVEASRVNILPLRLRHKRRSPKGETLSRFYLCGITISRLVIPVDRTIGA